MTITITNLQALDGDTLVAVHVLMLSDTGERDVRIYHILPEQYAALKVRVGETDFETVDAIEQASQLCGIIRKGLQLLSYGAQSERTLKQKLRARGYAPDLVAEAAAYLNRLGLVNEQSDALRIAQNCRRKHWGMRRILSFLYQKGYPESAIRSVQEELEEEDFVPDCAELIRTKYGDIPEDRAGRQKMIAALMRYGYSMGEIRCAMELAAQESEK